MQLKSVRVQNYRSIDDSGVVPIDDITCMVGKNEAGKTAFLQALHLLNPLNPINGKTKYDDVMDYPSKRFSAYKKVREDKPANVVTAVFELTDDEIGKIEEALGAGVMTSRKVTVTKGYSGTTYYTSSSDVQVAIAHLTTSVEAPDQHKKTIKEATSEDELIAALRAVDEPHSSVTDLLEEVTGWREQTLSLHILKTYLAPWLPRFFYFSDYSTMKGRVSLPDLKAKEAAGTLSESDKTFLSLLETVDADLGDFEQVDFEALTRELEGAANGITEDAFTYWRQNPGLRVTIQMSQGNPSDPAPLNTGPVVNVRIYNPKHAVTVPFDERSRGFVWFFSFYAYFSNLKADHNRDTILLLDEPGLSLHASGQADVLNFIEDKLAPSNQVVYTTHSPFLIDTQRIDRVRTVQDLDDAGTTVSADAFRSDRDTVFPLQTALGYDLAQTLFVGPHCLLVEGPSDYIYLQLLSQACESDGRAGLDPRWVVTPVGGADKVSTFVSLLGANKLNVAVLIDANPRDQQRIKSLQQNGHLGANSLIQVSEFVSGSEADLEDLFDPSFYCKLVTGAYAGDLPKAGLKVGSLSSQAPRITARVEHYFKANSVAGGRLNHYRPSAYFLSEQSKLLPGLSSGTLDRASELFKRVNACLAS
ncbi:AAA family ATPase [Kribbella sp. NBC_00382]|uniref:ATP-dependent nuclease n=1 Tax=Kribbella sp. NBC_00382 TaxID=2975967 RepID=UPI002E24BAC4